MIQKILADILDKVTDTADFSVFYCLINLVETEEEETVDSEEEELPMDTDKEEELAELGAQLEEHLNEAETDQHQMMSSADTDDSSSKDICWRK